MVLTPIVSRKNNFIFILFVQGIFLTIIPFALFNVHGFLLTSVFIALYAIFYRWLVPVSDSLITSKLGDHQEKYGAIRVAGSVGFVVMALVMQKFCKVESISLAGMTLWLSVPAVLFIFAVGAYGFYERLANKKDGAQKSESASSSVLDSSSSSLKNSEENSLRSQKSTFAIMKSFGLGFWLMIGVIFFEFFGMTPANNFLSMYVQEELKISSVGFLWAFNSICEIPFMFLSGFFIKKFGEKKLILICTVAVMVRNLLYAFVPNFYGAILGQMTHSLTYGLFFPCCIMFASRAAARDPKATMIAFTIVNSLSGLAAVIGASVGGIIIDLFSYRILFLVFAFFVLCAVLIYEILEKLILRKRLS